MPSVYVHVPFCLKKCDYCDFFSVAQGESRPPHREYLAAVIRQLEGDAPAFEGEEISSVYFGGGTPSLMPPEFFGAVVGALKERLGLAGGAEVSAEANPGSADAAWFSGVREAGVTRVSLGVQSFSPRLLKYLGRAHTAEEAMEAMASAGEAGFESVSLDLMYAIGDESAKELGEDLRTAMTFQPKHISAYALTVEEGTPLYLRLRGKAAASEEESLRQMRVVGRTLSRGGWGRYEISNFAKPGFECRHNQNYWRYGEYLGLGAGATSFVFTGGQTNRRTAFGRRFTQVRDVSAYVAGTGALSEDETIDERTAMGEFVFMGLRTANGISAARFAELFGEGIDERFSGEIVRLVSDGLLLREGDRMKLTEKGTELSNQAFATFV